MVCLVAGRRRSLLWTHSVDAEGSVLDRPAHRGGFVGGDPFDPPGGAGVGYRTNFGALAFPICVTYACADYDVEAREIASKGFDKLAKASDLVGA